jgi:hypothetical protein
MTKEKLEAIEQLKKFIPEGETLYTQTVRVSQSGMTRHIKVRQLKINKTFNNVVPLNWSYLVSKVIGWGLSNATNGVIVRGCGMDMGFHLIETLSRTLYGKGNAIKHEWL